jgi:hypothetical protein
MSCTMLPLAGDFVAGAVATIIRPIPRPMPPDKKRVSNEAECKNIDRERHFGARMKLLGSHVQGCSKALGALTSGTIRNDFGNAEIKDFDAR